MTVDPAREAQAGRPVRDPERRFSFLRFCAALAQIAIGGAGLASLALAASLSPETAVHEIFQGLLAIGGLALVALAGIWSAVSDAPRR